MTSAFSTSKMSCFRFGRFLHFKPFNKTSHMIKVRFLKSQNGNKNLLKKMQGDREYRKLNEKSVAEQNLMSNKSLNNKHWHVEEGDQLQKMYDKIKELGFEVVLPNRVSKKITLSSYMTNTVYFPKFLSENIVRSVQSSIQTLPSKSSVNDLKKDNTKEKNAEMKSREENTNDNSTNENQIRDIDQNLIKEKIDFETINKSVKNIKTLLDKLNEELISLKASLEKTDLKGELGEMKKEGKQSSKIEKESKQTKTEKSITKKEISKAEKDSKKYEKDSKGNKVTVTVSSTTKKESIRTEKDSKKDGKDGPVLDKERTTAESESDTAKKDSKSDVKNRDNMILENTNLFIKSQMNQKFDVSDDTSSVFKYFEMCRIIAFMFSLKYIKNWKSSLYEVKEDFLEDYKLLLRFLWNLIYGHSETLNFVIDNSKYSSDTKSFILNCDKEGGDKVRQTLEVSEEHKSDYFDIEEVGDKVKESSEVSEDESDFSDIEEDKDTVDTWEPPVPLTRGEKGVFDVNELVVLLKEEKALDVCVIKIPTELRLADYMVIVSVMSARHLKAISHRVNWMYKQRKSTKDPFLNIGVKQINDWVAINMGNIIVHIFLPQTREKYDLETLWTVGPEYDDKSHDVTSEGLYSISQSDMEWLEELQKSYISPNEK